MTLRTEGNSWAFQVSNLEAPVTPGTAGTAVSIAVSTPNAKGSWAQMLTGANMAEHCYLINVVAGELGANTFAKDALLDIGIDPAGGTSYTVLIPDLLVSCAAPVQSGGVGYLFPLFIPAGASVAARVSINAATAETVRVVINVFGKPSRPDLIAFGTYVTAFGITAASSSGTAITPGTSAAEGSYVSLGAPTKPHWWWQVGCGINNAAMTALMYQQDLAAGDATNKDIIIRNSLISTTVTEIIVHPADFIGCARSLGSGSTLYVRSSCSGTPATGFSAAAYGLG